MRKTPLMRRVEEQIGREIKDELKHSIDRGNTLATTAVKLDVDPETVRCWAKGFNLRFTNRTPWKDW